MVDAKYDVLAWNRLATHFISDLSQVSADDRNMIRWMFRQPDTDPHGRDEDIIAFTQASVADLRASYGRYPGDHGIETLATHRAFVQLAEQPTPASREHDHSQ